MAQTLRKLLQGAAGDLLDGLAIWHDFDRAADGVGHVAAAGSYLQLVPAEEPPPRAEAGAPAAPANEAGPAREGGG